jgi:carbon starvation protein CstA
MFPLAFVASTTLYAGWRSIVDNFLPIAAIPEKKFMGELDAALTAILMVCVIVILVSSARSWIRVMRGEPLGVEALAEGPDHRHIPGSGCC